MIIYTIYLITNLINQKKYVGQTKNYKQRFKYHIASYKKSPISNAIQKYGKENFIFEVIYQTLNGDHVDFLECHFIKEHNSFADDGHGYNLTRGGNCNKIISKETKQKMSEAAKGQTKWLGKSHTEETKLKLKLLNIGKIMSEESRQKMSVSAKTRPPISEETRSRISKASKGRIYPVIVCPHCGKEGGGSPMLRYHFGNCKLNSNLSPNRIE